MTTLAPFVEARTPGVLCELYIPRRRPADRERARSILEAAKAWHGLRIEPRPERETLGTMKELLRFNNADARSDQIEELCDWVRSLGVDTRNVRSQLAIVMGERSYELHLSEYVRDEQGKQIVDHAFNNTVSKPLIVDLGQSESWPKWLNEYRV